MHIESSSCCFPRELVGAFHYTKPTSQRPVGIPEENGTTFSKQTRPTKGNGSYHFLFLSWIPYLGNEPVCQKNNSKFRLKYPSQNKYTTSWGDPKYCGQKKPKQTFPFDFNQNFQNFWHNKQHPMSFVCPRELVSFEPWQVLLQSENVFELGHRAKLFDNGKQSIICQSPGQRKTQIIVIVCKLHMFSNYS